MKQMVLGNSNVSLLAESNGCSVFQFRNHTGDGTMTKYDVFPGVIISFNDFHMNYFDSKYVSDSDIFCIDHCREGRIEYIVGENMYAYVEAKDMKLDCRLSHTGRFDFPSGHYHGLTVILDMKIASEELKEQIKDLPIKLNYIRDKFCLNKYPKVIHGMECMEHIFGEMYRVPEKIKIPYLKIKIMELLLYLEAMEIPKEEEKRPYFYKAQVEKIKAIQTFITENMENNYTQEELSAKFEIPLTPMKICFKSIYGSSIGIWLTKYRMNRAAEMLCKEKEISVSEIAGRVGYDSSSKFAIAFRRIMDMSPIEYRNDIRLKGDKK